MEKHPLHLKIPELQKSDEVQEAVEKHERLESAELEQDFKLPNDATERIQVYMDRLEKIFFNPDARVRERNLKMMRPHLYNSFIIKPEQVPESYFELQKKIAREREQAVEEIPDDVRKQMIEVLIADQKASLDNWLNYLTSEDATYPTWFKYFVFRNILKLSQFDKALGKFKERTDTTVAPYPDVYQEPLAKICDIYEQVAGDNSKLKDPEIQKDFSKKFPKLYAQLITESLAASMEGREEIAGEWVKFEQGNVEHAKKLYDSLDGKGTGWCTAGLSTAKTQIDSGDFYVYYTNDKNGVPTQPRIAIRMNGTNEIGEVRGVQKHQSLEPQMNDILEAKLSEFGPEADKYKKKTADMRRMTEIEEKTHNNTPLTKTDLEFLYEINSTIEGFGYQKDTRIEEIRNKRNVKEDLLILFDCKPEQIATNANEVNENTVAYVGEWNINIYNQIKQYPNIKYLYESFPDKKIFTYELTTDPSINSSEKAEAEIKEKENFVSDYAKDMLAKIEFSGKSEKYKLVKFTVSQLGLPSGSTTKQIFEKAKSLGLELCPAEIGPQLRIQYQNQPNGEYLRIAMNPIADRDGGLSLFRVRHDVGRRWLYNGYGKPGLKWHVDFGFVFLSRK